MSDDSATRAREVRFRISPITAFFLGILATVVGFTLFVVVFIPRSAPRPAIAGQAQPVQPAPGPVLRLEGSTWRTLGRVAVAEGQVTNTSSSPLRSVEAVVSWLAADGSFVTSHSAVIEYDPLAAGDTSPWKVVTAHDPSMATVRVEFKQRAGGKLSHTTAQ